MKITVITELCQEEYRVSNIIVYTKRKTIERYHVTNQLVKVIILLQ